MVDRLEAERNLNLIAIHRAIKFGHPISHEDLKNLVVRANEVSEDPRSNMTELAKDIANRHFWTFGTKKQITLTPDEGLAQELTKLRDYAVKSLDYDMVNVDVVNCQGLPRDDEEVYGEEGEIILQSERVEMAFNELIDQATSKSS